MTAPIKRGTARRLGLVLPQHVITIRIEPDLSAFRAWGRSVADIRPPFTEWTLAALRGGQQCQG